MTRRNHDPVLQNHRPHLFESLADISDRCDVTVPEIEEVLADILLLDEERAPTPLAIAMGLVRNRGRTVEDGHRGIPFDLWDWHVPMVVDFMRDAIGETEKMAAPGFSPVPEDRYRKYAMVDPRLRDMQTAEVTVAWRRMMRGGEV